VAHVTSNAAARAMLAAMQWLAPPTFPTLTTSSYDEANAWVSGRLARARPGVPAANSGHGDALVTAGIGRAFLRASDAFGVTRAEVDALGVLRCPFDNLDGYVPYRTVLRLVDSLTLRSGNANLGLSIGSQVVDPAALGVVGVTAQFSAALMPALLLLVRYALLIDENLQLSATLGPDGLRIAQAADAPVDWPQHYAEFFMAALLSLCRALTSKPFYACDVGFRHSAPADVTEHAHFFGCLPAFGTDETFLVIPTHVLDESLATCDPLRSRYLETRLEEMARARTSAPGALADVRSATRTLLSEQKPVTTAAVAVRLGLSSRTLQRRLNERGVTFAELLDSSRREAAMGAIARRHASIQEVALSSGFVDVKAFRRAFVRWTGLSPSEYRKSHS
jgi:AraC-like DNA-binding protein